MAASKNSKRLPGFDPFVVLPLLAAVSAAAVLWCAREGWTLFYGDAEAHLNIARRVLDSRTPAYFQIGTVWLPLPHALMIPLARDDGWWRSGLAGAIPVAVCYVLAGAFLYSAARRAFDSRAAAAASLAAFALNPNLLYLQAAPMTEPVFFACLAALLYFTVRFRDTQSGGAVLGAGIAALAGTLTRYEGWFLIPFVTAYFLLAAKRRRLTWALVFGAVASLGPLYWLAHNWWYWGDCLEFYRGPYSAKAIYQRALVGGMAKYPGDHDWGKAWLYFHDAVMLCAGRPLAWLAMAGAIAALWKRRFWALVLPALPAAFILWSMHSGSTPIFVPHLWPNTYYNTRYGLEALPLLALCAGALASVLPVRARGWAALGIAAASVSPWAFAPRPDAWVCWKESQVNSEARRKWTREAAVFLRENYRPGQGIFFSFGDLAGVLREAGIPLHEGFHNGNVPHWEAAAGRPDLFLWEDWALTIAGDKVSDAIVRAQRHGPRYKCVKTIVVKGAPVIHIYRRAGAPAWLRPALPLHGDTSGI